MCPLHLLNKHRPPPSTLLSPTASLSSWVLFHPSNEVSQALAASPPTQCSHGHQNHTPKSPAFHSPVQNPSSVPSTTAGTSTNAQGPPRSGGYLSSPSVSPPPFLCCLLTSSHVRPTSTQPVPLCALWSLPNPVCLTSPEPELTLYNPALRPHLPQHSPGTHADSGVSPQFSRGSVDGNPSTLRAHHTTFCVRRIQP